MTADGAPGEGCTVPAARLRLQQPDGWHEIDSTEFFRGKTVVAFALPGAFTPTCSSQHLPRYEELAEPLKAAGVDALVCISVNDTYVMEEWGRRQGLQQVQLIADGNGDFSRAMGMLLDDRDKGMGTRSRRYSMLVRDGRIEKLFAEPEEPGDPYSVSDADTMLDHLAPGAPRPPRILLLSKPGCPYCAKARWMLQAQRLRFDEIELEDARRGRVLGALTGGATTTPQVFVDGEHVGDSEALAAWLERRSA